MFAACALMAFHALTVCAIAVSADFFCAPHDGSTSNEVRAIPNQKIRFIERSNPLSPVESRLCHK
jgi:hypothetical protein